MHLTFAPAVRLELLQIGETIEADSPARAATFVRELEEKARNIALNPKIYRVRSDLAPGIRLATYSSYVILFRHSGTNVEILHIVHGARDLRRLFED
jgi:toxin ParE1/3/4